MKTIDFIEIGTSSFNTLLQESKDVEIGFEKKSRGYDTTLELSNI